MSTRPTDWRWQVRGKWGGLAGWRWPLADIAALTKAPSACVTADIFSLSFLLSNNSPNASGLLVAWRPFWNLRKCSLTEERCKVATVASRWCLTQTKGWLFLFKVIISRHVLDRQIHLIGPRLYLETQHALVIRAQESSVLAKIHCDILSIIFSKKKTNYNK